MQPSAAGVPLPIIGAKKCTGSLLMPGTEPTCRAVRAMAALVSGTRSHVSIAQNFYLGGNAVKRKCGCDHEDKFLKSMKEEQSYDLRTSAASRSDAPGAREHSSKGVV